MSHSCTDVPAGRLGAGEDGRASRKSPGRVILRHLRSELGGSMGFVSYLEDIRDRFNDSLKGADLALKRVEKTSNEQVDQRLHQLRLFIIGGPKFHETTRIACRSGN